MTIMRLPQDRAVSVESPRSDSRRGDGGKATNGKTAQQTWKRLYRRMAKGRRPRKHAIHKMRRLKNSRNPGRVSGSGFLQQRRNAPCGAVLRRARLEGKFVRELWDEIHLENCALPEELWSVADIWVRITGSRNCKERATLEDQVRRGNTNSNPVGPAGFHQTSRIPLTPLPHPGDLTGMSEPCGALPRKFIYLFVGFP
jgi:hypothetical protein